MTDSDRVLLERADGTATVTVNRPEKRNAMDVPTRVALRETFETLADDEAVSVVVLRGAGDEAFVTGGDIESFAEHDLVSGLEYVSKHAQGLYNLVADVPKPTVAAIDGHALGGGLEIALACDLRVATTDSRLGVPEVGLGVLPAGGGTQRLTAIVGAGVAKELVLTGKVVSGREAADLNLVTSAHPPDEFEAALESLVATLQSKAPLALRLAKESVDRAMGLEAGLDFERIAGAYLFGTDDQTEGARAFLEGRDPEFTGR